MDKYTLEDGITYTTADGSRQFKTVWELIEHQRREEEQHPEFYVRRVSPWVWGEQDYKHYQEFLANKRRNEPNPGKNSG